MAYFHIKNLCFYAIFLYIFILINSNNGNFVRINAQKGPTSTRLTGLFPHLSFNRDYKQIFGESNAQIYGNGSFANISLTKKTGNFFCILIN